MHTVQSRFHIQGPSLCVSFQQWRDSRCIIQPERRLSIWIVSLQVLEGDMCGLYVFALCVRFLCSYHYLTKCWLSVLCNTICTGNPNCQMSACQKYHWDISCTWQLQGLWCWWMVRGVSTGLNVAVIVVSIEMQWWFLSAEMTALPLGYI